MSLGLVVIRLFDARALEGERAKHAADREAFAAARADLTARLAALARDVLLLQRAERTQVIGEAMLAMMGARGVACAGAPAPAGGSAASAAPAPVPRHGVRFDRSPESDRATMEAPPPSAAPPSSRQRPAEPYTGPLPTLPLTRRERAAVASAPEAFPDRSASLPPDQWLTITERFGACTVELHNAGGRVTDIARGETSAAASAAIPEAFRHLEIRESAEPQGPDTRRPTDEAESEDDTLMLARPHMVAMAVEGLRRPKAE